MKILRSNHFCIYDFYFHSKNCCIKIKLTYLFISTKVVRNRRTVAISIAYILNMLRVYQRSLSKQIKHLSIWGQVWQVVAWKKYMFFILYLQVGVIKYIFKMFSRLKFRNRILIINKGFKKKNNFHFAVIKRKIFGA